MNPYYETFMREYQERKKYDGETSGKTEASSGILIGLTIAGIAFTVGFIVYWIVRLGT